MIISKQNNRIRKIRNDKSCITVKLTQRSVLSGLSKLKKKNPKNALQSE